MPRLSLLCISRLAIHGKPVSCADPEIGTGGPDLKNQKNIGFLSNTGPDPLKNHKAARPAMLSNYRHVSLAADDGPL